MHNLDRHISVKTWLIGFVDFGHPTPAQPGNDAVLTQSSANQIVHAAPGF